MNNSFFSDYNFNTNERYISKIEQAGFSYPSNQKNITKYSSIETFQHNKFNTNVTILQPEFVAGNLCSSEDELKQGGSMILNKTMEISTPVVLTEGKSLNLNLNNQKIVAGVFAESNGDITEGVSDSYCFWVKDGAMLSIEGDGEVVAQDAKYSMAVWAQGGVVEIKGGKFYNGGDGCDLIYASNGGKVYIYGGEYHASEKINAGGTKNKYTALNIKDADRSKSKIVVYGGKFFGFNPANNLSEGVNTNFVAEGYTSIEVEPHVFEVRKA